MRKKDRNPVRLGSFHTWLDLAGIAVTYPTNGVRTRRILGEPDGHHKVSFKRLQMTTSCCFFANDTKSTRIV